MIRTKQKGDLSKPTIAIVQAILATLVLTGCCSDRYELVFMSNRHRSDLRHGVFRIREDGTHLVQVSEIGSNPVWTSDGQRIVFKSKPDNSMWKVVQADGSDPFLLTEFATVSDQGDWAPDDSKFVFNSSMPGFNEDIWTVNPDGTGRQKLIQHSAIDGAPCWHPEFKHIAFHSNRDGKFEIYRVYFDGTNLVQLTDDPEGSLWPSWSPDGRKIAFASQRDGGDHEIYTMNFDGSGEKRLTYHPAKDRGPSWSPDGKRIAFTSLRSGNADVWTMNATDGSDLRNVTDHPASDHSPDWRPK